MTRYYLIKEVDGIVVRKTEVVHAEPRDSKGRFSTARTDARPMESKVREARHARCPQCGYEFLVA